MVARVAARSQHLVRRDVCALMLRRYRGIHGLIARAGGLDGERGWERSALHDPVGLTIVATAI